jgi:hypothetical protein
MLEQEAPAAFLKLLVAYEDGEASLQLKNDLVKADRETKCIHRAISYMLVLFILSLAGLSYCAILLPQIYSNPTYFVTKSLSVLGAASMICLLEFFGYLLWHLFAASRLQKECRRRVLLLVESRLTASLHGSPSVDLCQEPGSTLATSPSSREEDYCQNQRYESAAPGTC